MIVVDKYGLFYGVSKKTSKETLLALVYAVARGKSNTAINKGLHNYLIKVYNIKSD